MPRTLADINKEIAALQKEAEVVRPKEVKEVVARIKEAISFYALSPEDLFGTTRKSARSKRTVAAATKARKERATMPGAKPPSPPKYKDPVTSKTWTGIGKRPRWFVDAMAAGKTAEELAV